MTRQAFENAIAVAMAMGCSTNAVIHLIAMARRAGHAIGLDDFDAASRKVPVIANIRPCGDNYLMEDFYYAGGLPGLMSRMREHLHLTQITVTGKTLGENIEGAEVYDDDVIRPLDNADLRRGRAGGAEGQSRARRLRHQAERLRAAVPQAHRPALVFDDYPEHEEQRSTTKISMSPPITCWCCATPARRAARACPNGACCRSRRSS